MRPIAFFKGAWAQLSALESMGCSKHDEVGQRAHCVRYLVQREMTQVAEDGCQQQGMVPHGPVQDQPYKRVLPGMKQPEHVAGVTSIGWVQDVRGVVRVD